MKRLYNLISSEAGILKRLSHNTTKKEGGCMIHKKTGTEKFRPCYTLNEI